MSWRIVVISKRAKLDLQLGYMVVRSEEVTKIVLSEISTILIESTAVSITTSLIAELAKRKIKVIFCDEKKNPSCELVNYYGSHDTSNKVRKQIAWKQNTKETVWTEIVTEKIRKQKELLEKEGITFKPNGCVNMPKHLWDTTGSLTSTIGISPTSTTWQ